MKKIILGVIATVVVVTVAGIFYACKKEEKAVVNSEIIDGKIQKAKLTKEERQAVAGADLTGFVSGAGTGAGVGAAIGAGVGGAGAAIGATIGAGVGGIVGAIGGSLKARAELVAKKDLKVKAVPMENMIKEARNDDNPYDSIGFIHYAVINYLTEYPMYCEVNSIFDNKTYYNNIPEIIEKLFPSTYINLEYYPYDAFIKTLSQANQPVSTVITSIIKNPEVIETIINYDYKRVNSSFDEFYVYSISVEKKILDASIDKFDKQIILSYMATARYGYWYWDKAFLE